MDFKPSSPSFRINYLYFGVFLALLLFISICSMLLKEGMTGSRFFFLFHAGGQAVLEVLLFVLGAWLIRQVLGRLCFWLFVGFSFVISIVHILEFMLDRVLDMSILQTLAFVYDESFDNFLYLLDASGVPLWLWAVFFSLLACLPLIGMAIYKISDWIIQKRPLFIRHETLLQACVCIPAALLFWDFSASRMIHPDSYTTFRRSLPWKQTFFHPRAVEFASGKLNPALNEQQIGELIAKTELSIEQKPSVFLFVTESLRGDFITEEIAPHLTKFRDENIRGEISLSNGNGTHLSWFSIFHSQFSFLWNKTKKAGWKSGSPALALLKNHGYKIRVYSAAQLGYYGMGELIFGEKNHLADSFQIFEHSAPKPACYADRDAIEAMRKDLREDPSLARGNVFVIFLDSTHFDYSWPRDTTSKFRPFGSEITYFQAYQSQKNISLIKNRYRNAIHYVDSLFGQFLSFVPSDALIAFMGDHGEEFFDQGHLFHNSHLSKSQTSVPIFMKIRGQKKVVPMVSQMDVMPTLLDGIAGAKIPFLQGESVLRERVWPFVAIARFNAGRCPYEWCLHNGTTKLIMQFDNHNNITESTKIHLLSLKTHEDHSFPAREKALETRVEKPYKEAFDRLFMGR